jgi:broad specificity phosphatase PhoE
MAVERVLLVRHGQTDWNTAKRWQGFEPIGLNAEGLEQARKLAKFLCDRPIGDVYTSDLPRAAQTAQLLAQGLNLEPVADERWRELNLGIFQGLTSAEVETKYALEWGASRNDYFNYVIPRGESRRQLQTRAYHAWQDVLTSAAGPETAVVTHGGTIKMLLFKLFESEAPALSKVDFTNTSITTLERYHDHWRIIGLAAAPHLLD